MDNAYPETISLIVYEWEQDFLWKRQLVLEMF